jgi:hypothetical protein
MGQGRLPRLNPAQDPERLLVDLADARVAAMDKVGVDVQVMSLTTYMSAR